VIDEVAGMALALAAVPRTLTGVVVAFALFRLFDIAKPPPVSWCEGVSGGAGVMLDDVVAGALAFLVAAAGFALCLPGRLRPRMDVEIVAIGNELLLETVD
jgi:phosphatidylglycerophosphatase A